MKVNTRFFLPILLIKLSINTFKDIFNLAESLNRSAMNQLGKAFPLMTAFL
jgi:hypothetical protein